MTFDDAPVGVIVQFIGDRPPRGWWWADGTLRTPDLRPYWIYAAGDRQYRGMPLIQKLPPEVLKPAWPWRLAAAVLTVGRGTGLFGGWR